MVTRTTPSTGRANEARAGCSRSAEPGRHRGRLREQEELLVSVVGGESELVVIVILVVLVFFVVILLFLVVERLQAVVHLGEELQGPRRPRQQVQLGNRCK